MTERLIVVDLAATSKNWALTPDGERRLREETPPGWTMYVVQSATSSDGDGPPRPSDEVMGAIHRADKAARTAPFQHIAELRTGASSLLSRPKPRKPAFPLNLTLGAAF